MPKSISTLKHQNRHATILIFGLLYFQYGKDPTISINDYLFVIGDGMAKEKAAANIKEGKASIPFNWQQNYWWDYIELIYIPSKTLEPATLVDRPGTYM